MFLQEIYQSCVSTLSGWVSLFFNSPIHPVMYSRCLSADGFRFSRPPTPAGEFGIPCGLLTHYEWDSIGITTFYIVNARLVRVYLHTPGPPVS